MTSWEDHQAIVDVTLAYAWALDSRNWDGLDAVFTEDATADLLGTHSDGRVAITERISTALARFDSTQHIVTNHQVAVAGDAATCRSYLQAQHVRKGTPGGENFMIAGRYEDELTRTPAGWRITHRVLTELWQDGNPATTGRT